MFRSIFCGFAVASLALASPAVSGPSPADWAATARADVEAAYALMRDNHPGWEDPDNKDFRKQLTSARSAGLSAAEKATDSDGYAEALSAFSTLLSDGHAGLRVKEQAERPAKWPGFVTAWRGDRWYVAEGTPAPNFEPGSTILSCDGVKASLFIRNRLEPRGLRSKEEGRWWAMAGRALVDSNQAAGNPPNQCTFENGGKKATVDLRWESAPSDLQLRLVRAADGGYTDIGLSEPRSGLFLIGLSTFQPGEVGGSSYRKLYADLAARRGELARARAIVLDLRFNEGGSSAWSLDMARTIWGKDAIDGRMENRNRPVEIWWRASDGNIAYLSEMEAFLRKEGQAEFAEEVRKLTVKAVAARAENKPFAIEAERPSAPKDAVPPPPLAFDRPVYVMVPGRCASACLDALDLFKQVPGTRLIGAPTSADSQYMEVRTVDLPSGQAFAVIPIKVWMHRPRKGGEIYRPDIAMKDLNWSTDAFLDVIEADIKKRALR